MSINDKGELVTVAQAQTWLNRNPNSRPISERAVIRLVSDMEAGRFTFNGESIKIDEDGNLLDGQHRLTAIVRSGIPQELVVVRGIDRSVLGTIDLQVKRTAGQWLGMNGYSNIQLLAGAARQLYFFMRGHIHKTGAGGKFNPPDALAIVEAHPELVQSVDFVSRHRSSLCRVYKSYSKLSFLHYLFSMVDSDKADSFVEELATGIGLKPGNPIIPLRDRLQDSILDPKKRVKDTIQLAWIIKSWNVYLLGRKRKRLYYGQGENFPLISGFTYSGQIPIFPKRPA